MMIRRLTSAKPPLRASQPSPARRSLRRRRPPEPEAHRVELRQVRGALGRQDQVVGGQRVNEVRAGYSDDLGAELGQVDGLAEPLLHAGRVALLQLLTTPIFMPATSPDRAAPTTSGTGASIEVESRIVPGNDSMQQGGVKDGARAWTGLIKLEASATSP